MLYKKGTKKNECTNTKFLIDLTDYVTPLNIDKYLLNWKHEKIYM